MFRLMKLRPPHGWRAAWWEFGIVSLGVLLALGAEQTIKEVQDARELATVREALRNEARLNLSAVELRVRLRPCVERRLNELQAVFQRHHERRPLGLRAPVNKPPYWTESTGTWQIALAGDDLTDMPLTETLAYSEAFDAYRAFTQLRDEEDGHWRSLSLLDDASLLDAADWSSLRRAYAEARAIDDRIASANSYILD